MRTIMKIATVLLAVTLVGVIVFAEEGEKEGAKKKKKKLTKEEKKALREKMKLAAYGRKLFQQSNQFSTTGKGCNSCHSTGGEKDLRGKVTEESESAAHGAIKKCLENRMKIGEDKFKKAKWDKNPKNLEALVTYLSMWKAPRGRK